MKHIAIFGGTFDPIHNGHVGVAESVILNFALDMVYFMPTALSPLKADGPVGSRLDRLKMVELAIDGKFKMEVLDWEISKDYTSFTIETALRLHQNWPNIRFYWIIGADLVESLPHWHRIEELVKLIDFIAVKRPGYKIQVPYLKNLNVHEVTNEQFDISSTEIRERMATGMPIDEYVPERVNNYILINEIYKNEDIN